MRTNEDSGEGSKCKRYSAKRKQKHRGEYHSA